MNPSLKTFTEALAKELKLKLQSPDIAEFVDKVKASGDDRTFEVVMSTSDEDRQGDELDQSKWELKYYDMNPVVLWAHNYQSFPIGIVTDITIQGNKAVATGKFAPAGINPDADMACALYQEKILRTVSPGYIQNDDGTRELLEISFCPVPAGRYALSLRQVRSLGVSTRDLVTKGFFFETKAEQVGDTCQLEDGTPGTLAKDPDDPGKLICVPDEEGKSQKEATTTSSMNEELTKNLKAETTRHQGAIAGSIAKVTDNGLNEDGSTKEDTTKEIDEFEKAIDDEHAEHLDKCMKAIDEKYELQDQKKSVDEFKSAMQGEHLEHVKCFDKAIDEFKDAWADGDDSDRRKAIDDFTTKSAAELIRHEKAQTDLVKAEFGEGETDEEKALKEKGAVAEELQEDAVLTAKYQKIDKAFDIFYAFVSAFLDDAAAIDDYEKLLDEAVALMKGTETKSFPESKIVPLIGKAGASISAKNKEKIQSVIKALTDHNSAHADSTNTAIASLKELMGSPQEGEGEEQKSEKTAAPKQRSNPPVVESKTYETLSEFDSYMLTRKLLKGVYIATGDALAKIKQSLREKYPDRK